MALNPQEARVWITLVEIFTDDTVSDVARRARRAGEASLRSDGVITLDPVKTWVRVAFI